MNLGGYSLYYYLNRIECRHRENNAKVGQYVLFLSVRTTERYIVSRYQVTVAVNHLHYT